MKTCMKDSTSAMVAVQSLKMKQAGVDTQSSLDVKILTQNARTTMKKTLKSTPFTIQQKLRHVHIRSAVIAVNACNTV